MNPVLGIIGNMLGGSNGSAQGNVGNAQANSAGNNLKSILSLYGMLKGSSDPMGTLQQMAGNNSAIKNVFDYIQQNGGDAKSAFYKLAEENGVDPNYILKMLN